MKILYVTTISNTVNAFLIPHIKLLIEQGHQVDVAFNIVDKVDTKIIEMGCRVYNIEFQRSPLKKQNYSAYKKLKKLIQDEKYKLVHTHTPVASACVRIACRKMNDVKVFYTAHGFHFFKGAPIKNWLIYYTIERWLARYTDVIITINKEDYARAKKSFKAGKVEYIPGIGLDTKRFSEVVVDKSKKRKELGVPNDAFVVLSVGECSKRKNHEIIIKAIAKLKNPNIYYIICGRGPLEKYLSDLAKKLGIDKKFKLLGFRRDIADICKIADVFAFPSKQEGLPVALMESMVSGLPIVCSDIRGDRDLIKNKKGGYLVKTNDVDGFSESIYQLIHNFTLRENMGKYNKSFIVKFDINIVTKYMEKIYFKNYCE